ncbi:MAG TPA: MarR family transcriptional regulator [Stackebrandtia sp.]|jgi:DNA-binding MarR family transcriptional regulator|uniref:MarR family winged helix-turn-helix transcriptional regulator n=1 Tax=Stackebrandtia sp. TaxID=2023065 RepID=UPI002D24379D|nr:MarR family transcriptional regulator [Stackebrandtia sp.]HZE38761.1 MarR family transcriptional regulator [Stackebrandtia sp.]
MGETEPSAKDATEIAAALRLVVGRIARKVRAAKNAVEGLALSEASVLARLDRDGPGSPGSLAEQEGVRPQAMAATLAALEERGLVSRGPDASDRRRAVMAVTPAGRKTVADRRSVSVRRLAAAITQEFTPDERGELLATVELLDRLAERL